MSDNVIKQDFTGDYQTFETAPSGVDSDFAPFFSLTSEAGAASKDNFSAAEVSVVSQAQAKNEDWQVFTVPHEDANFAAAAVAVAAEVSGDGALPPTANLGEGENVDTAETQSHDAGYEQGYQEGYDQGFALGQTEGEIKGIEAGQKQVEILEQQRNEDMQVALGHLSQLTNTLSDELLQPMQTLAVHLAKELVRGDLSLSSQSIERLITLSMEQLKITQSTIQVHMNPLEFERLQQHNGLPDQVVLQPSNDVSMGSIKVEHADSWVEDLMEDRLAQISQQAFGFIDEKFIEPIEVIDDKPLPTAKVETEAKSMPDLEPVIEAEAEAVPELEPVIEAEAEAMSELEPVIEVEAEAMPELEPVIEAEAEAVPELEPVIEAEAVPELESERAPKLDIDEDNAAQLVTATEVELDPAPDTELEAELETELETALEVDLESDLVNELDGAEEVGAVTKPTDTAVTPAQESTPAHDELHDGQDEHLKDPGAHD